MERYTVRRQLCHMHTLKLRMENCSLSRRSCSVFSGRVWSLHIEFIVVFTSSIKAICIKEEKLNGNYYLSKRCIKRLFSCEDHMWSLRRPYVVFAKTTCGLCILNLLWYLRVL